MDIEGKGFHGERERDRWIGDSISQPSWQEGRNLEGLWNKAGLALDISSTLTYLAVWFGASCLTL